MTTNATATMDPKQTKLTKEVKHNRPLTTCFWDPLSRYVFFGAEDHFIHRFDITSGKVSAFAGHDSWVRALVASADGKTLYSAGYDGRLIFWEAAANQPKPQRTIEAHQGWVRAVTLSRDGKYLATCGNDRMVKVWRASDGQLVKEFTGHKTHVYNVVFQHDSKTLVSCDHKGVKRNPRARTPHGKSNSWVRHNLPCRHRRRSRYRHSQRWYPTGAEWHLESHQCLRRGR